MTQFDFILIGFSIFGAILFLILGMSKLIKFYIGLLIGLLICILINLKLSNLALSGITTNAFEAFLSQHRDILSTIALGAIPFMGFLFLLNRSFIIQESEEVIGGIGSIIGKFFMGLSLFPLILGMYSTVGSLGLSTSSFLNGLIAAFKNSIILSMFSKYGHYIFLFFLGVLLYKFVFKFLFYLLVVFFNKIRELRAEEREIRKTQEEDREGSDENN